MRFLKLLSLLFFCFTFTACGYNDLQVQDEAVKAQWSEVINQYQRRADLVPNLVSTVKGYAAHEKAVLVEVTNARAKVGSLQVSPDMTNQATAMRQFQQAQGELSSALSRLLMVTENYPQLKADTLFRDLQAQLEGTENRIAVARNRYIQSIKEYNATVRKFPTNITAMIFGFDVKPNFTVENENDLKNPPKVDFN